MIADEKLKENYNIIHAVINNLQYIPQSVDIEELEQIGLIALWKAMESYNVDITTTFQTYCYGIINRDIIDYLRKVKPVCLNIDDINCEGNVTDSLLTADVHRILPRLEADLIMDKYCNGYTYNELAERYNLKYKQVRYKIEKSMEKLKINLKMEE